MRIAVVHQEVGADASADDTDVLVQCETVSRALASLGHEVASFSCGRDLEPFFRGLEAFRPDCIFNLIESYAGKGKNIALIPFLLERLQIPYTGASAASLFLTSNKIVAKWILRVAGLPTPNWVVTPSSLYYAPPIQYPFVRDRYILKSVWEHASIGLSAESVKEVEREEDLFEDLEKAREGVRGESFAERFIEGREFNLSLLEGREGPEVLPIAEIEFVDYPPDAIRIVDYKAKWDPSSYEYHHTPRRFLFPESDAALLAELRTLALSAWKRFQLRGYARVDFRIDLEGRPWILEINANPCLSPDAGFMAAAREGGKDERDVIQCILAAAMKGR